MPRRAGPKRIAFLDTNALLDLFLYWEVCGVLSLQLDGVSDIGTLETALASSSPAGISLLENQSLTTVDHGLHLFNQLLSRSGEWDFYTSQLCRSEMHHTLLAHRAAERLAAGRLPWRLRMERPLIVYRTALDDQDYSALEGRIESFFVQLRETHGVDLLTAELTLIDFRTVAEAAERVWSKVLFEVMDAFIYASALTSMADVLITRDSPFRDAVNKLHAPPDESWRDLRKSLDAALATPGHSWPRALHSKQSLPR